MDNEKEYITFPALPGLRFTKRQAEDMFKPRDDIIEAELPPLTPEMLSEINDYMMHNHKKKKGD